MAGITQRAAESAAARHRGRSVREVLRRGWSRPLRFETLEDRVTPSFSFMGIPQWLENGPFQAAEGQVTGISGTSPNPASGAVEEISPHPTDPNILFAAGVNGGVWRTTNALTASPTWVPLTDQLASPSLGDMDINPANPDQVIAGSGRLSSFAGIGGDLIGALVSDNASSASPQFRVVGVGVLDGLNIRAVLARGYLLAGGERFTPSSALGLTGEREFGFFYRSTDNGQTWGGTGLPGLTAVYDVAADPADPRRVYVVGPEGIFRTDDITTASPSWVDVSAGFMGFATANIDNAKIAIHHSVAGGVAVNVVYLATASGDLQSMGFSTNAGGSWTEMDRPQSLVDAGLIVDATFATPIQIDTLGPHALQTGDRVYIQGVTGNLGANAVWTVTRVDADSFTLDGSAGTGIYTGGGTFAKIFFTHPGGQSSIHFSLAADPTNPNLVYIGGDRQDFRFYPGPNQSGNTDYTSNLFRGDRTILRGFGGFLQSPQWTEITGTNGAANGGSPHADSRSLAFDAQGNLIEGDDGGVYKRFNPSSKTGSWVSLLGNLNFGQFMGVAYDSLNNVVFGGTQDTGSVQQLPSNAAQFPGGNSMWETAADPFIPSGKLVGDGGVAAVDNVSYPGLSVRYEMGNNLARLYRNTYNANGALVSSTDVLFYAPDKIGLQFSGFDTSDGVGSSFTSKYVLNTIDPRLGMLGMGKLYEDNDPTPALGKAFDVVAKVTPAGMTGQVTTIVYGGKQILTSGEVNLPRIAWVGTTSGQVFVRGAADGFFQVDQNIPRTDPLFPGITFPAAQILDIAVDPDDWRTAFVVQGEEYAGATANTDAAVRSSRILLTTDAGASWVEVNSNLFSKPIIDFDPATGKGTNAPLHLLNPDGTLQNGQTSEIATLAVFDPSPGTKAGGFVLLAGGRGGVFRAVVDTTLPSPASTVKWSELGAGLPNAYAYDLELFGNRLVVGTQGRGAWSIADMSTTIGPAVLTVNAGAGGSNMSVFADPTSPTFVIVDDGQGNTIRLDAASLDELRFVGTADGVDTVTIGASGSAGGDLSFVRFKISVDLKDTAGDVLIVRNAVADGPVIATITDTSIGGAPGDTLFSGSFVGDSQTSGLNGARIEYTGLHDGTVQLDLGADAADGNQVYVLSSSAANTEVLGGTQGDQFLAGGAAAGQTSLDLIGGWLKFDGRGGLDTLIVTDAATSTANAAAQVGPGVVTGFAGSADQFPVLYENLAQLILAGGNSTTVGDFIVVDNPTAELIVFGQAGPDTVLVRANNLTVSVDGGSGDNQLIVDRSTSPTGITVTVANNAILGATAAQIGYAATGGRFFTAAGDGVRVIGSNTAADLFNLLGGVGNSQIALEGGGGDDTFVVTAAKALGIVLLRGGDGSDRFNIDAGGVGGNKATSITADGGGGGNDVALVSGSTTGDDDAVVTVTDSVSANLTGLGGPVFGNNLTTFAFDGRLGHNTLTFVDGTAGGYGSAADPLAGIVYKPTGGLSGEVRLAGGTVGPVVAFDGVNGKDVDGFVVQGANGDTLAVLLASDVGLGGTGALSSVEVNDGSDTVSVSDQLVTTVNRSVGYLRAVAIARGANGRPTIGTLVVRTGNEGGVGGDTVTATPSSEVNIVVDGGNPTRRPGDKLTVDTTLPTSLVRVGTVTRVTATNGQGLGFTNFETIDTAAGTTIGGGVGRSGTILAVGADQGGGPRLTVYDAATQAKLFDRFVYVPTFTGGVRVATGDVNGDGVQDVIVGAGYGGGPHVQVLDGVTFQQIANFFAYENTFRGGMYVAAGDLDGDGKAEIITGVGLGGGPLVKVFDGTGRQLSGFFAYDQNFRGGVRVGAGDVNGDGNDDIITGAGPGGGPHVKVFNAGNLVLLDQFLADAPDYTTGVYVAAGDLTGDGAAEVIVGPGGNDRSAVVVRRSGTHQIQSVSVFDVGVIRSPDELPSASPNVLSAIGSESKEESGIRVAVSDFAGVDGKKTIVTARGPGYPSRVNFYSLDPPVQQANFLAYEPEFIGGLFVG